MTPHLTDEQLGATRDGALSGAPAVAADRHLAECAECRARLAAIAALDAELSAALEHDPGEAYFASFAGRVASRIASAAPAVAAVEPRRGFAAWWGSPRRVAWAGGALAVVAVAALVVKLAGEHGPQELVTRVSPARELGASAAPPAAGQTREAAPSQRLTSGSPAETDLRKESPAATPAPLPEAAVGTGPKLKSREQLAATEAPATPATSGEPQDRKDRDALRARDAILASPKTQSENVAPHQVIEVRTQPNGEPEAVAPRAFMPPAAPATPAPAPAPGFAKPAPGSLAGPAAGRQSLAGGAAKAAGSLERKAAPANPAPPEPAAEAVTGAPQRFRSDGIGSDMVSSVMVCGKVRDTRGRPAAGALVTVAESGGTFTVGADGAFCADIPESGGTLSVLAVGYRAARMSLTAASSRTPLDITLSAVDVLGTSAKAERGLAYNDMDEPARKSVARPSLARHAASGASAAALKAGTADAWTLAAQRWETVERLESASGNEEAGFRVAEARVNAWLVGRNDAARVATLRAAARKATQAFLDHGTDTTSVGIALGWYRVLLR